jgi:tetratricopeptide (TPR) repeat protein
MDKKNTKKLISLLLLFTILVSFRFYLDEPYIKIVNPGIESIYDVSVNMAAVVFGETRKTIAAYLWGKVLRYHAETSHGAVYTKEDINNPQSGHSEHNYIREGKQTLPMARLITWLDNHFDQAYDFCGYFLAINLDKVDEGVAFIKEGINNNTDSYTLHYGLAYIYYYKVKNYNLAITYAKKALDIALTKKNLNEEYNSNLFDRRISTLNAIRILAHSYRKTGDKETAKEYFLYGAKIVPSFAITAEQNIKEMEEEK